MAKAKKTASKVASRKKTSTKRGAGGESRRSRSLVKGSSAKLPANWRDELAKDAAEEAERTTVGSGSNIQLKKNNTFSFQGANLGESFNGVIVDHVYLNKYYDSPFDEQNPTPPACFSLSSKEKGMEPHPDSPAVQHKDCSGCWAYEFGSAERGRGKACGNRKRVAIIHEDDLKDIESAEIVMMEVPTTSKKTFDRYVGGITKAAGVPSYAVLTTFSLDPDADHQTLVVEMMEVLPQEAQYAIKQRFKEAREMLMAPFDTSSYTKPKGGSKGKGAARRGRKDDDDAPRSRRGRASTKKTSAKKRGGSRFS